jgi:hypothetical protein
VLSIFRKMRWCRSTIFRPLDNKVYFYFLQAQKLKN